tara:strand:+ start:625 stop:861 length:237 start_codon:yes stop_codon:yes gene_type:complete
MVARNPQAYYSAMGFTSLNSLAYTGALAGIIGGGLGMIQSLRRGSVHGIIPWLILFGAGMYGAGTSFKIADEVTGTGE